MKVLCFNDIWFSFNADKMLYNQGKFIAKPGKIAEAVVQFASVGMKPYYTGPFGAVLYFII